MAHRAAREHRVSGHDHADKVAFISMFYITGLLKIAIRVCWGNLSVHKKVEGRG